MSITLFLNLTYSARLLSSPLIEGVALSRLRQQHGER